MDIMDIMDMTVCYNCLEFRILCLFLKVAFLTPKEGLNDGPGWLLVPGTKINGIKKFERDSLSRIMAVENGELSNY